MHGLHVQNVHSPLLGFGVWGMSQGARTPRRGSLSFGRGITGGGPQRFPQRSVFLFYGAQGTGAQNRRGGGTLTETSILLRPETTRSAVDNPTLYRTRYCVLKMQQQSTLLCMASAAGRGILGVASSSCRDARMITYSFVQSADSAGSVPRDSTPIIELLGRVLGVRLHSHVHACMALEPTRTS